MSNAARRANSARPPRAAALLMLKIINKRMDLFNAAVESILFEALEDFAFKDERFITSEREDAIPPFITRRLEGIELRIAQIFDDDKIAKELNVIGQRIATKNGNELRRVVGVNIRNADPGVGALIDEFRARNVARIKSLAGKQLTEITEILNKAETPNLRVEVIRDQIRERFKVSKSRATLLARDQALTLNGQIAKQRQTNLGIVSYVWTTSGDDRVRDEHAEREGVTFRWDRPPEDGHPGEPIQCRCTAFPVLPELVSLVPKPEDVKPRKAEEIS